MITSEEELNSIKNLFKVLLHHIAIAEYSRREKLAIFVSIRELATQHIRDVASLTFGPSRTPPDQST